MKLSGPPMYLVDSSNSTRPAHVIDHLDQKMVPAAQVGCHTPPTMLLAIMPAEMSR